MLFGNNPSHETARNPKMLSKKMRLSSVGVDRSLVRGVSTRVPKERKRFTPWLEEQIEEGDIDGLEWIEKDKGIFKVPWVRVDKPEFVLETHAELFKRWAEHTGKYRKGDQPDPSTWKTRFRCALRKMQEIVEIRELGSLEGSKPYRAFKFEPKLKDRSNSCKRSPGKRNSRPPSLDSVESDNLSPMEPIRGPPDPLGVGRMLNPLQVCDEYYRSPEGNIIGDFVGPVVMPEYNGPTYNGHFPIVDWRDFVEPIMSEDWDRYFPDGIRNQFGLSGGSNYGMRDQEASYYYQVCQ